MWDDSAKYLMVQAAEKAGFGKHRTDFNLINEPESAAAYTLREIQYNKASVLSHGAIQCTNCSFSEVIHLYCVTQVVEQCKSSVPLHKTYLERTLGI